MRLVNYQEAKKIDSEGALSFALDEMATLLDDCYRAAQKNGVNVDDYLSDLTDIYGALRRLSKKVRFENR